MEDSSSKIVVKNSAEGIFPEYTLRKAPFINEVLRKAGYDRLRALKANTKEHWEVIQKLQQKQAGKKDNWKRNSRAEYFVFYKGVDIIGCAEVIKPLEESTQKQAEIVMFEFSTDSNQAVDSKEIRKFFKNLLKEWCLVHGYKIADF